ATDAGICENPYRRGAEPVEILALVEHDLQRADPQHEQPEPDAIDRRADRRRLPLAIDDPGDGGSSKADRNIDVEDPRPGNIVGDPTTEKRTDDRRDQRRARPHPKRAPLL